MNVQTKWFWSALGAVGALSLLLLLAFAGFAPAQDNASVGVQADAVDDIAKPLRSASRGLPQGELSEMSAVPVVPEDLKDPAFDRYVDLRLAGDAIMQLDAALATDVALQLAEAEHVLLRSHRGASSDQLFWLAARIAVVKHDKASLQRLIKAAGAAKLEKLATKIAAQSKLLGESRAIEPAHVVSILETKPEAFALYRSWLQRIDYAKAFADREELSILENSLSGVPEFSKEQIGRLRVAIRAANAALPDKADSTAELCRRLAGASRTCPSPYWPVRVEWNVLVDGNPNRYVKVVRSSVNEGNDAYFDHVHVTLAP